jgi:2-polyprenyl-6-methoxyphenol hydroxylase-like FAD-dependent oxidoreductase
MTAVDHAVVIAGGGPTGMMLAAELTLAGVEPLVVEPRPTQELDGSRAGGLHARTLEVLDQRGVVDRFLAEGQVMQVQGFAGIPLDIGDFPTRHNYGLALWQRDFERIMAAWVAELGVRTLRGRSVVGCTPDDEGVAVALSGAGDGPMALRAAYLVGCDGGRSVVRKAAGIDFAGHDASTSYLIAEVAMEEQPPIGMRREGGGIGPVARAGDGGGVAGPYRVVLREPTADRTDQPTLADLRELLVALFGTDFGAHSPTWVSRFTDTTRQAAEYRRGRVLLAGDAAHVHAPMGGQGLNVGVQDAVNLGWKLARVAQGRSPDDLLDTYHAERHPVAARVLHNTMAQVALSTGDDRHDALRDIVADLLALDEPRRRIAAMVTGLDVHYDLGAGPDAHPLVGRRVPDVDLDTAAGPTRLYEHLHRARPLLLNLGAPGAYDAEAPHVDVLDATAQDVWPLPLLGEVPAPEALLVRPDGHAAWTTPDPLHPALETWFGTGEVR